MSWVRKVRHIQDVAPWLQPLPSHSGELDRIDDRNDAKLLAKLGEEATYVEKAHRLYFRNFCHDSDVLAIEKRPQKLIISLNSIRTIDFAWHIDQIFGTSYCHGPWRIHLVSHDVADFRIVDHDHQGRIRPVPLPPVLPFHQQADKRPYHPEYLRDFGWKIGDRVAWVVEMFWLGWALVDCGRLTARDEARIQIGRVYGPTISGIYEEILGRRPCPVPLPDRHWMDIDGFLRRRMSVLDVSLDQIAEEIWQCKRV